ncbi:MAG: AAA family ATPase [Patescibacteria group bacterium]|nr:AAA family ATPase [Patescibacteria group bacterium]MDE2438187.1 AAA family ATPase [Patescibacteria group bacterium]
MTFQTITITEYLTRKGIPFRKNGKELITRCIFSNCDDDSKNNEAHLYFEEETGRFHCKKCDAKGNLMTLAKHFGDDTSSLLLEDMRKTKNEISTDAMKIWQSASQPPANFPYLTKKKISAYHSRFWNNNLILPLYSSEGFLSSLQFVDENGNKKFLKGGKTAGCYSIIREPDKILCVAEGFATAASIAETTGYAVAIAFSASNLKATAMDIRRKYPDIEVVICGDTDTNGSQKAKEAAEAIGARLAFPSFEPEEKIGEETPSDFNDLCVLHGGEAVLASISSAVIVVPKFGFTSLNDLLKESEEEISWVVENLLPSGGFSIVIAKPKVGKSTLARQAALAVARGEPFLGRQVIQGAVLYVSLEEKRSEVRSHFQLMGATGSEDLGVYVGSLPDSANEWLKSEIERKKPILVIVDTLFRFASVSDVNDYSKVIKALDPLLSLARTYSAHVMGIHHARKGGGDGADTALGSTAIFGSVDTAIVLKRTDSKRTIETQQRYGTDMEPSILLFDPDTKMVVFGGTKEEDDVLKVSEAILELLKASNEPMLQVDIDNAVEGRTTHKRRALQELVKAQKIGRTGSGKKGDPFQYSCSLVPTIYTEQEKQETKSEENGDTIETFGRSQSSEPIMPDSKEINANELGF